MRIRLTQPMYINGRLRKPGTVIDIHESMAQWLMERGRAARVEQEPAPMKATAGPSAGTDTQQEPAPSAGLSHEPAPEAEPAPAEPSRKRKAERRTDE